MEQPLNLSAIPIRPPHIDNILEGTKKWEIRSRYTKKIGPVGLIKSGSGTVVGLAYLAEVFEITMKHARENYRLMGTDEAGARDCVGGYAWVLKDVIKFKTPVPYKHPSGAVTWVTLDEETTRRVFEEAKRFKPKNG